MKPTEKGTWQCPWCGIEITHETPYRSPLPVTEGWPVGTGQVVCGPGCTHRPVGVAVYQHWGRGAS